MRRPVRTLLTLAAAAALAAVAVPTAARHHVGLSLRPPHRPIPAAAALAGELQAELEAASSSAGWTPRNTAELVEFALQETRDRLKVRPGHPPDLTFLAWRGEERAASSEEYAQLFAAVFRHVGRVRAVPGRATVMRSEARLFGMALPWPGWRTHDWVRVEDGAGAVLRVDPTLDDAGLGWSVADDVVP